jgi:RNA polymerase sigma factor (sigma-70 family)
METLHVPAADLVQRAAAGDQSSWNAIVRRYASLIWSVCRRHGLAGADADDVTGTVWLRLLTHLATLREPAALPGWLRTTTRRECHALLRKRDRQIPHDPHEIASNVEAHTDPPPLYEGELIVLREAIAALPDRDRRLLALLLSDPPATYAQISTTLGIPIGAIGPTRQRCLARIRRHPSVATLLHHRHQLTERLNPTGHCCVDG